MTISTRDMLLGAITAFGAAGLTAGAGAVELRLAHAFPPNHLMHVHMFQPWAAEVAKQTNGELTIKLHPGGDLVSGPTTYKRVADGVADMGYSLQGYTSDQFPRSLLMELPGLAPDNATAARMMHRALDLLQPEYDKTKVLALWSTGPNVIMTRRDPFKRLEDINGKRIRTPSAFLGEVAKAIGASPVSLQITDVYQSMQTGVIDAVLTGYAALEGFKLGEVIKHYSDYQFGVSPLFAVMNQKSYERLSAAHRAVIDRTAGLALALKGAGTYDSEAVRQLDQEIKSGRGELHKIAAAERRRMDDAIRPLFDKLVADRESKGIPARQIIEKMRAGS
jgi:TRAP-type C4-dicarboxylate transport system substrate-binding protein